MNRPSTPTTARRRCSRGEAGSAYVLVLVALVVLVLMGLSLAFTSQTEVQIGANDRKVSRVFYAAESGIAAAEAKAIVAADYSAVTFSYNEPGTAQGLDFKSTVEVSPLLPILDTPCNLCEINDAGSYSEKSFRKINHAVTAVATRYAGTGTTPLAQKALTAMVEMQPWKVAPDAYKPLSDPVLLAKIKF
ncbi:MAG TPA: PilX N-terminal domain-containing pilus assembly protein [Thermoanaerobaculia bacterium]|nr:PilX N-terminal domain-containing pilus assembly protein [Thermoanaerobaculia bacterium]